MSDHKKFASSIDVARLAGVSQSAVSRTYKPGGRVSAETRRRVLEAADRLGYRPSLIPRIMLTHRSYLVAIAIGGMYNPFNSAVLEQFTMKLQATGYQVLLVHVDSGDSLDTIMPRLASYRVDAIFVARAILTSRSAEEVAKFRIPIISFHTPLRSDWVSSVCCDNATGGRLVADLFADRGARSPAYVAGVPTGFATQERWASFRRRWIERGGTEPVLAEGEYRYEGGVQAAERLLVAAGRPDAVFCANDLVAIGVIDTARRLGLRVPEDLMVAGFDDIAAAGWAAHDLTTLVMDGPAMVDESLEILRIATSDGLPPKGIHKVVPTRLIERGTTRRG
ncbi:MAG TPA: LacI family DNA-binding transcriptional regulator [Geminicoccaceae bacterium]|nr:LacI family DNA-binding transcriptional regulator [Geminicoccus sp.]HMU51842.1 LacI family DNA-binding transcriptional regulator [Geminicoccaceae bacterium]